MEKFTYNLDTIGGRLKYHRLRRGKTQQEMASCLNISVSQYKRYEHDISQINMYSLAEIAKILNISIDELLKGKKRQ